MSSTVYILFSKNFPVSSSIFLTTFFMPERKIEKVVYGEFNILVYSILSHFVVLSFQILKCLSSTDSSLSLSDIC